MGGKVLKMENVMSIVLLTESFFLFQTSQSLPSSAAQLRGAPVVRTAPASVTGERQANYADEECNHVDLQGKSRTITFLSYV